VIFGLFLGVNWEFNFCLDWVGVGVVLRNGRSGRATRAMPTSQNRDMGHPVFVVARGDGRERSRYSRDAHISESRYGAPSVRGGQGGWAGAVGLRAMSHA
jgi:hypothetical protein